MVKVRKFRGVWIKKMESTTKLPKLKNNHNLEKLINKSLNNLKINQIDTLLFHDTTNYW